MSAAIRRLVVLPPVFGALLLVGAAPAAADVLVNALPKRLTCGAPIQPGVWAQAGTTGDRTVRMRAVDLRSGKVWWRRTVKARTRGGWRFWTLPSGMDGRCRPTKVVYELAGGVKVRYRIRFRAER
jgi:hypothetical protein